MRKSRKRIKHLLTLVTVAFFVVMYVPSLAGAQDEAPLTLESVQANADAVQANLDNLWVFLAGALVFFMQAGFALVEAGLTRAKSVVNIMAKNMSDAVVGVLSFYAVGYAFAFGGDGKLIGTEKFFLSGQAIFDVGSSGFGNLTNGTFFFFQAVFAATAVTIVSGAMAERTKFPAYLAFSAVMCAIVYPVVVHWTWGGGLIAQLDWFGDDVAYSDFAGSGIVHMTGGIAAFFGAKLVGPRIGKYGPDGKPRAIPGHNIPFAILGVFILWLGWFGFNPGSELAADTFVMHVAVNTMLAAVAGGLATTITIWMKTGKPDLAMIGNGVLAGLVGITAPCGAVNSFGAVIIGLVAGVLVVFAVFFFENHGIDDPVGAISVHGVCGAWGLLSVGLFARYNDAFLGRDEAGLFYGGGIDQLLMQLTMLVIILLWVGITSFVLFSVIKATIGLRVSEEEEHEGLDVLEHGLQGYATDAVL